MCVISLCDFIYLLAQINHTINSNNNNIRNSAKWSKKLDEHIQMPTVKPTQSPHSLCDSDMYDYVECCVIYGT